MIEPTSGSVVAATDRATMPDIADTQAIAPLIANREAATAIAIDPPLDEDNPDSPHHGDRCRPSPSPPHRGKRAVGSVDRPDSAESGSQCLSAGSDRKSVV